MRDDVLLCLSELVSNAVVYAGPNVGLRVVRAGSELRLEVHDGRPLDERFTSIVRARQDDHGHPPTAEPSVGGRGLLLVDELSREWGVSELPGETGKVVWCVMAAETVARAPAELVDLTASSGAGAVLLEVPRRYLIAHELRIEAVVLALNDESAHGRYAPLAEQIDQAYRTHLDAWIRPPDARGSSMSDRVDVAFDVPENPYRSAVELSQAVAHAESLVGPPQPAAGVSAEDLGAFEQWYLEELRRQSRGEAPVPCPFPARPTTNGT